MRRLMPIPVFFAVAMTGLGTLTPGAEAIEFGGTCTAQVQLAVAGSGMVQTGAHGATASSPIKGVVTAWTIKSEIPQTLEERLKILRPEPGFKFLVVAASEFGQVGQGTTTFPTQIPIAIGDELGLGTKSGSAVGYCKEQTEEDQIALFEDATKVGGLSQGSEATAELAIPVRARVEPDLDGDGFGDETQDACPVSALLQTPCPSLMPGGGEAGGGGGPSSPPSATPPPVAPRPLAIAVAHKASAVVKVTSDEAATVTVKGRVALGGGAKVTPSAGSKPIGAGAAASFTLKFPKALRERLAALPTKRTLTLHVEATATGANGLTGAAALNLKLHGLARRALHGRGEVIPAPMRASASTPRPGIRVGGEEALDHYMAEKNTTSIDGLPAFDPASRGAAS